MKFFLKTYGCQMNERDSESAAALLCNAGFEPASSETDADLILLNTCSVRDQAERKAAGKLRILKKICAEGPHPHPVFGLMGCMAQNRGPELLEKIPHLDFVIGTDQIHQIPDAVRRILAGEKKLDLRDRAAAGDNIPDIDSRRLNTGKKRISAFLSIMRGCDRFCSYCIVPYVRGRERSRAPESILKEAEELVREHGVREIMLLGQNVAAYGLDHRPPPPPDDVSPFADLLKRLSEIEGLARIRFTSPHPAFFNAKLIEGIASCPKVCKGIHLPLQSGSDRILKLMNRPYTAAGYLAITEKLRKSCPGVCFTTDVIAGFPGETEEDFEKTREVMDRVGFSNAFIFKYSPRPGTKSALMPDDVPQEEKERRNQVLLADLAKHQEQENAALLGTEQLLMAEGPSKRNPDRWSGRTDTFKLAVFTPDENTRPGDLVRVKIVRATSMTLYGELLK